MHIDYDVENMRWSVGLVLFPTTGSSTLFQIYMFCDCKQSDVYVCVCVIGWEGKGEAKQRI